MKKHRGRHLLSLLASAALLASLLPAAFAAEAEGEKHITILGTSDMHGNIWGYSYEDNAETDNNGMARLYTYIQQVRAENPNTFLVDAGDDIQGTIMTDDLYNKTPEEPHPVVTAMNYMGYDAMTLGNHEFNWASPPCRPFWDRPASRFWPPTSPAPRASRSPARAGRLWSGAA